MIVKKAHDEKIYDINDSLNKKEQELTCLFLYANIICI